MLVFFPRCRPNPILAINFRMNCSSLFILQRSFLRNRPNMETVYMFLFFASLWMQCSAYYSSSPIQISARSLDSTAGLRQAAEVLNVPQSGMNNNTSSVTEVFNGFLFILGN